MDSKHALKEKAAELGFVAAAVTDAEPSGGAKRLLQWLETGCHGYMDYLAIDPAERTQPKRYAPEARSVVVAAWPYGLYLPSPPNPSRWKEELRGRIAAYAFGSDYHDVLAEKMEALARVLYGLGAKSCRVHVDAGPLMEKELARRAGIGWYGRNTNILSKSIGSNFLIACLLTDLELEPDPPFEEFHCGDCEACVVGCPTGALGPDPSWMRDVAFPTSPSSTKGRSRTNFALPLATGFSVATIARRFVPGTMTMIRPTPKAI